MQYHISSYFWVNYNDLTATSLEIMVSKGNHPQMALIQVSELLQVAQIFHQHTYGDLARITCHVFLVASSTARIKKRVDFSGRPSVMFVGLSWPHELIHELVR